MVIYYIEKKDGIRWFVVDGEKYGLFISPEKVLLLNSEGQEVINREIQTALICEMKGFSRVSKPEDKSRTLNLPDILKKQAE